MTIVLLIGGLYLSCGLVFAIPFAFVGAKAIDPVAAKGTLGFKFLIIPGSLVLWPLLLLRWITRAGPHEEWSEHRRKASDR